MKQRRPISSDSDSGIESDDGESEIEDQAIV